MNRKIIIPAIFISFLLLLYPVYASDYPQKIPSDFRVTAMAGGLIPGDVVNKVEISPDGSAVYYELSSAGKPKNKFVEKARFKLENVAMDYIYYSVNKNNFFGLKNGYRNENVVDGNFAELKITSNGKTHTVRTRNIRIERFDDIMIDINIVLPKDYKIIYNEILS